MESKIGWKCSGSDSLNWQQSGGVSRTIIEQYVSRSGAHCSRVKMLHHHTWHQWPPSATWTLLDTTGHSTLGHIWQNSERRLNTCRLVAPLCKERSLCDLCPVVTMSGMLRTRHREVHCWPGAELGVRYSKWDIIDIINILWRIVESPGIPGNHLNYKKYLLYSQLKMCRYIDTQHQIIGNSL